MKRRDSLKYLGLASVSGLAVAAGCKTTTDEHAHHQITPASDHPFGDLPADSTISPAHQKMKDEILLQKKFFTDHERASLKKLVDVIIPADATSGSASDAGTVEFIEFMMWDVPANQTPMRGGLRWLDLECHERFGKAFLDCKPEEYEKVLDDIAFPEVARPEMSQGVAFFNIARNFACTGFFTSKIGVEYLGYLGNKAAAWDGPPQEWLDRLGVS